MMDHTVYTLHPYSHDYICNHPDFDLGSSLGMAGVVVVLVVAEVDNADLDFGTDIEV